MSDARPLEHLLRELAPGVLAVLARRYPSSFDLCEDAVQEALLAAATQWPVSGTPDNARGWLITAASRRWIETWRQDTARRRREDAVFADTGDVPAPAAHDDSLTLLFLCCHPSLTPASQVALTLRAVGGLTTAEIARALLVPEATVAQRISRAKARIRASGTRFTLPGEDERPARLAAVLHVIYLIFNEGYTATSGRSLHRVELSAEAIRLGRQLHGALDADADADASGEVVGLLALMLLTDARRPARTTPGGALVPLPEQDRTRWDHAKIAAAAAMLRTALPSSVMGPYQVQAAIAAVHDEAAAAQDTDWLQILGLYDVLVTLAPGPVVTLNRVVAVAMVHGAPAGLAALAHAEPTLAGHHRIPAVRAHLLDLAGRPDEAREQYAAAARTALNAPERDYLRARAGQRA